MEYIEDLYQAPERPVDPTSKMKTESAPEIIIEELEWAIKRAKNRKACGTDGIPAEMIICFNKEGKRKLLNLLNRIYRTGELSDDFKTSVYLLIL